MMASLLTDPKTAGADGGEPLDCCDFMVATLSCDLALDKLIPCYTGITSKPPRGW
jgi:hypothetical protein